MDISVVTVTWNAKDHIISQMQSVQNASKDILYEQIIVDNGSTDNTVEIVQNMFPNVYFIKNHNNKGFGYANNQGLRVAKGEFLLFLNPDMKMEENSMHVIVKWMRNNPNVGIASCKLVDLNKKVNSNALPRRFPNILELSALLLKIPHLFPSILNRYYFKDFNPEIEQKVDSVRGSFMLVRRSLLKKLGWAFDPRYFIWFEDVDLCKEAYKYGYDVVYTPCIQCIDYVGQSFVKRNTLWKQREFTTSMSKYVRKWHSLFSWIIILILRPIVMLFAYINDFIHKLLEKKA